MSHDELRNRINTFKTDYSSKGFSEVVEIIKREKINDDLLLQDLIEQLKTIICHNINLKN